MKEDNVIDPETLELARQVASDKDPGPAARRQRADHILQLGRLLQAERAARAKVDAELAAREVKP